MKPATAAEVTPEAKAAASAAVQVSHDKLRLSAKLVALVTPFMATKDIRYYLCGINIRPHPAGGAAICATNGHILGAVYDPDAICEHEVTLRMHPNTVAAMKVRGDGARELVIRHGRVAVMDGTTEIALQPGDPVIDGKYPQYQNVIPDPKLLHPGLIGQFNAKNIALLHGVVKIAGSKMSRDESAHFYTLNGNPNSSAVALIAAEPNFIAVIMPMRSDVLSTVPEWCAAFKPKDDLVAAAGDA